MFFRSFLSIVRQMSRNLGHIRPRVSYCHHILSKPYSSVYVRRRSLTIAVVHDRRQTTTASGGRQSSNRLSRGDPVKILFKSNHILFNLYRGSQNNGIKIIQKVCVCVPMPIHCTITRFGFHARRIDGVKCGLFSNHAPLGQITLRVGRVSV